VWESNPRPWD